MQEAGFRWQKSRCWCETGQVRVKGFTQTTNAIFHPWIKEQVEDILNTLPEKLTLDESINRQVWKAWQHGLMKRITLPEKLPPLRILLTWDNLQGHYTPELVLWLFAHGVMLLYTPLGSSWLNMAESIQSILVRRGLGGQSPHTPEQIISWLEAIARSSNDHPTPFEWGGARAAHRERARQCRIALGGSGAWVSRSIRPKSNLF